MSIGANSVHLSPSLLHAARPLLQEQDVGGHVGAGVGPKRGVWQTERAEQHCPIRQVFSNRRVLFVHRVAARDQGDQPARPDHVEGLREEIVVDTASQLRTTAIGRIEYRVVAKRNVPDRCIEKVFRESGVFERFAMDVRIRVEFGGDSSRNRIEFNAGAPGAFVQVFRHESEEMADTHGRFENVPTRLKSKPFHRAPDRLNDFWRSVMSIGRGGPRRCELLGGENIPQLVRNTFPLP